MLCKETKILLYILCSPVQFRNFTNQPFPHLLNDPFQLRSPRLISKYPPHSRRPCPASNRPRRPPRPLKEREAAWEPLKGNLKSNISPLVFNSCYWAFSWNKKKMLQKNLFDVHCFFPIVLWLFFVPCIVFLQIRKIAFKKLYLNGKLCLV